MLAVARERLRGPFVVADASALPFRDEAVDLTLAVTVLEFVSDPARVLDELARVTRRGGDVSSSGHSTRPARGDGHTAGSSRNPRGAGRAFFVVAARISATSSSFVRLAKNEASVPNFVPSMATMPLSTSPASTHGPSTCTNTAARAS